MYKEAVNPSKTCSQAQRQAHTADGAWPLSDTGNSSSREPKLRLTRPVSAGDNCTKAPARLTVTVPLMVECAFVASITPVAPDLPMDKTPPAS